jgi:hypothetical protein
VVAGSSPVRVASGKPCRNKSFCYLPTFGSAASPGAKNGRFRFWIAEIRLAAGMVSGRRFRSADDVAAGWTWVKFLHLHAACWTVDGQAG